MSHLLCPFCGLSVPLSKFDPEAQDNDICLVSYIGKGRGQGFEKGEQFSILGDPDITGRTVDRVCALYKFFRAKGFIQDKSKSLGIDEVLIKRLNDEIVKNNDNKNTISSLQNIVAILNHKINVINIENKNRKSLEEKLLYIKSITKSHIELNEDHEWIICIESIEQEYFEDLILFFVKMEKSERIKILTRINSEKEHIKNNFRYLLSLPKKKTLADILLEIDLNFPIELGKDGNQVFYDVLEMKNFLREKGKMGKNFKG